MKTVLQYDFFKRWPNVVITCFVAVIIYQGFFYLHPANQNWKQSPGFSWLNTLQFLLVDQLLIECITIGIIFFSIRIYAKTVKLYTLNTGVMPALIYFLSFLPLFLVVYFLFAPFTLSVRFLYHLIIYPDLAIHYRDYFFLSKSLYIAYLIPVQLIGYGTLGINFLVEKARSNKQPLQNPAIVDKPKMLLVKDNVGELPVPVSDIACIKKEGRSISVKTSSYSYFTYTTLDMLEKELAPYGFIRINRSTLLPLRNIKNYSFWENEKYILRTKDGEEHLMSRERLRKIKSQIIEGELSFESK